MQFAAKSIEMLKDAIDSVGFHNRDLKTTSFNIRTHYERYRDKDNNYKNRFNGYLCEQVLKLEFQFDTAVMSKVLTAIAKASIEPQLNIRFSVKDKYAVSEQLLINATENARHNAEILAKASGVNLGDLISIDYDWGELHLYSPTKYGMEERCMTLSESCAPNIEPDDIDVSDNVSFVWEIK
ncbi:SIMPL domain-containing protein [Mycoplasmatota bacterium zrk1]